MSYLEKTKHTHWRLEEAVGQKISNGSPSVESALKSIRSDLDFYNNSTAVEWKNNWKPLSRFNAADNSNRNFRKTYNTINNNGTIMNSTFSGDIVAQPLQENIYTEESSQDESQDEDSQNKSQSESTSEYGTNSIDIEFPSDLSKDYHPLVNEDHYHINQDQNAHETNVAVWTYNLIDSDEVCVINDELRTFRSVSLKLEPKSLSDLRLLSLNHVYLFTEELETSLTSYLPHCLHQPIMKDISNDSIATISDRCILWCTKLSTMRFTNWFEVQKTTIPYLNAAMLTMDERPQDLILANIIHRAAVMLATGKPDSDLEDSFVHNFISNLFENVLQTESILDTAWYV
ncbi:hypothetical protein G6F42_022665 [Rhizopus arrhizus]|nr:hypothetical protein G6F42_022665 [Rhizopus arrhizus]